LKGEGKLGDFFEGGIFLNYLIEVVHLGDAQNMNGDADFGGGNILA
jgi:hypothetical protein